MRKIAQCKQLAWKKIAEKNTISYNSGSEFDVDGKKLLFLIKMVIMRWMQYVYIKIIQLQQVNLMVTLWNAHHIFGIIISRQVNFRII